MNTVYCAIFKCYSKNIKSKNNCILKGMEEAWRYPRVIHTVSSRAYSFEKELY